jgi:hypothetical protein
LVNSRYENSGSDLDLAPKSRLSMGRHLCVVLGISTLAEISLQEEAKTCPKRGDEK